MKIVSTLQFKGGVGKTTALMALCCAAVDCGKRVALFDTDQNAPFKKWKTAAEKHGTWSDSLIYAEHLDFSRLQEAADTLDDTGDVDLLLVDSRAGRSDFSVGLAQLVDVLILPSRPVKVDADALLETLALLRKIETAGSRVAPHKVLLSHMKTHSQLTAGQKAYSDLLAEKTDTFRTILHERAAYQNMQAVGLMGQLRDELLSSEDFKDRGYARSYKVALEEAAELLKEVEEIREDS